MKPIISIIIPIYNREKMLNKLICSILNQDIDFKNLELLIIDNKSTDNSKNIVLDYSNKYENIKLVELQKHFPTPGKSRNVGISEASAEYIMFCDSDDEYAPDFCRTLYQKIKRENVDLISTRYMVNVEGIEKFLNNSFLNKYKSEIRLNSIKQFPEVIQTQANLTIWNKIYKKEFVLRNNIKFVEDYWGEDFLFSLECFIKANGILLLTDYSGYIYNIGNESHTNSKPSKEYYFNNGLKTLSRAETLLVKNGLDVMPYVSELIIFWIKHFLESDLNYEDLSDIYNGFKPWFKRYSLKTRLVNIPVYINVLINIVVKIFSSSKKLAFLIKKLYNLIIK